ncbi:MAG: MinD/ParA family protein [Pseudomonadota bacterium]
MARGERAVSAPRVISVTSGKGGVGKTNIVANLAVALSKRGQRVLVLDADLGLANLDILLGLSSRYNVGHVLRGEKKLAEVIIDGPAGIRILPASSGVQELTLLGEEQKLVLLNELDAIEPDCDILLIDTGAGISPNVTYFNLAALERIVVVTPEPTSITDAYALIKVMATMHATRSFKLLINQVRGERDAQEVIAKLVRVVDRFIGEVSLEAVGWVPSDSCVPRAVKKQRAIVELFPECPASRGMCRVADTILASDAGPADGNIKFFWRRLFGL